MGDADWLLQQDNYTPNQLAEVLVSNYYASIHHLAYSILGDADEADDAAQETFVVAVRKIGSYLPGTNLKAWLSTIAVNQCRDLMRKRKSRQAWQRAWEKMHFAGLHGPSPETQALHRETRTSLWQAVDGLGEKHRIPIVLRYVHDLPVREIAEILEISEGTVHSRLHYACRKLQKHLSNKDLEALEPELNHE